MKTGSPRGSSSNPFEPGGVQSRVIFDDRLYPFLNQIGALTSNYNIQPSHRKLPINIVERTPKKTKMTRIFQRIKRETSRMFRTRSRWAILSIGFVFSVYSIPQGILTVHRAEGTRLKRKDLAERISHSNSETAHR